MLPLRNIRIISDGTGPGTRIVDADGNELPITRHLDSIVWRIGPRPENMPAVAVITLIDVEVELTGDLQDEQRVPVLPGRHLRLEVIDRRREAS
jgi:hypothetical protein